MIILFYNKVLCLAFSFQFCLLGFYHLVSRLPRKSTSALFFSCVFCSLWICLSMQLHFFFGLFPSLALNHRVWWYPAIQPWQRTFPDTFSGMDAHKFSSVINLHKESRKSMSSCPCLNGNWVLLISNNGWNRSQIVTRILLNRTHGGLGNE